MGLLDSIDLEELAKKIQASYEHKSDSSPMTAGLLSAGLGILAANNGRSNPWAAIGQGGLQGVGAYQQARQAQQKDPMQMVQALTGLAGLQQQQQQSQALSQWQRAQANTQPRTINTSDYAPGEAPGDRTPAMESMQVPGSPLTPEALKPFLGSVNKDVRDQAGTQMYRSLAAGVEAPQGGKNATFNYFMSLGNKLSAAGLAEQADKAYSQAEKFRPELKDQKVLTDPETKQRVVVNYYKDGTIERQPFLPDQEKMHFADMGDKLAGVDPFTGQPKVTYSKGATPGETMSDARAREGMAQSDRHFNASQGQAERHFQANFNAPQVVDTGDGIVLADKRSGTARPLTDEQGKPIAKEKPLTEVQSKAVMFGSRMAQASEVLDYLESKPGFKPTSPLNKLAGAPGANYLAPKEAQAYNQAMRSWSEAELRYKSGAAVTEAEINDNVRIYFPQPGDSPELVAQKAMARKLAEAAMRVAMGGSGQKQMPKTISAAPSVDDVMAEIRRRQGMR